MSRSTWARSSQTACLSPPTNQSAAEALLGVEHRRGPWPARRTAGWPAARGPRRATAARTGSRGSSGRPRRATRILSRSRAFFDCQAVGGIGSPSRSTRNRPSAPISSAGRPARSSVSTRLGRRVRRAAGAERAEGRARRPRPRRGPGRRRGSRPGSAGCGRSRTGCWPRSRPRRRARTAAPPRRRLSVVWAWISRPGRVARLVLARGGDVGGLAREPAGRLALAQRGCGRGRRPSSTVSGATSRPERRRASVDELAGAVRIVERRSPAPGRRAPARGPRRRRRRGRRGSRRRTRTGPAAGRRAAGGACPRGRAGRRPTASRPGRRSRAPPRSRRAPPRTARGPGGPGRG